MSKKVNCQIPSLFLALATGVKYRQNMTLVRFSSKWSQNVPLVILCQICKLNILPQLGFSRHYLLGLLVRDSRCVTEMYREENVYLQLQILGQAKILIILITGQLSKYYFDTCVGSSLNLNINICMRMNKLCGLIRNPPPSGNYTFLVQLYIFTTLHVHGFLQDSF